jgi:hypothetical protein
VLGNDVVHCLLIESVDDRLIGVAGDAGGRIRLWDLINETPLCAADGVAPVRWLVAGGPDEQPVVVAGTESGDVVTVDLITGQVSRIVDSVPRRSPQCGALSSKRNRSL